MAMVARARIVRPCVLGLFACALAGCATGIPRHAAGEAVGNQGAAWEVVLPGADVGREFAAGYETSRRDPALGYSEPDLLAGTWPAPDQPTLFGAWRLTLPQNPNSVLLMPTAG